MRNIQHHRIWFAPVLRIASRALSTLVVCLVGLVALLAGSEARAQDDKSYPATSCRQVYQSTGTPGARPAGAVQNDSTSAPLTVICPIVKDNTQTLGSWTIEVRVDDRTNSSSVNCTAVSMNNGGGVQASASAQTTVAQTGLATLTITPGSSAAEGYSALRCSIPAVSSTGPSGIIGYIVRETGSNDTVVTDSKSYTATYAEILPGAVGLAPFVRYDDVGRARTINANADDSWAMPLVRDSVLTWWGRARLRMFDTDADLLVNCRITNFNEDGTVAGFESLGTQPGTGATTVTVNQNPNNPLYGGPIPMHCRRLAADTTANMYDLREETVE